ncbi:thiamine phosphate synthase [Microbacterium xanthum]|uniref:thiamine phosphate synthase n=1 Tax=Microbacterium xanthum TaxID=3079794 RepID=UPI002AD1EA84|nr:MULTISPECIES: thiamine phosphate synthase [unclassified Microbacterium]MDZ8172253.1 thiamine phosphate synthase [Microbacterium sp. KSW-48]MDZ8202029.1 thiamine phosphate synthase [Microbacterium sp. SSW1-59]
MTTVAAVDLRTYVVTDAVLSGDRGVLSVIADAVHAGAGIIQIREKNAPTGELFELVMRAAEVTAGRCALVVDDRVDVFLAARAAGAAVHGVHVGQSDLPVAAVRHLVGDVNPDGTRALVGLTANSHAHLAAVAALPVGTVDYLGVGVIRATATKPDHPAPLGIEGFAALAAAATVPCVAIGGIDVDDIPALRDAGAAGAAVVSAICAAPDPAAATRRFTAAWSAA